MVTTGPTLAAPSLFSHSAHASPFDSPLWNTHTQLAHLFRKVGNRTGTGLRKLTVIGNTPAVCQTLVPGVPCHMGEVDKD